MKKLIIVASIFFMLSIAAGCGLKNMDSVELYEDPNVIIITIDKK